MPSATSFEHTIDWDAFWRDADAEERRTADVGAGKSRFVRRFFDEVGVPEDVGSFGCGPGSLLFELAGQYPAVEFYGFDASPAVVEAARERADAEGYDNLAFSVAELPDPATRREFDLVYSYATLHYVGDSERAVLDLYDRVRDGGHLVVNYPNRLTRALYREQFGDDEATRERYELVFEGENLLSYRRLRALTGVQPHSYWTLVGAEDEAFANRRNPCVYVRK